MIILIVAAVFIVAPAVLFLVFGRSGAPTP
jgi:hypothetical protein